MSTDTPLLVVLRVIGVAATSVAVLLAAWGVASGFARASAQESFTAGGVRAVHVRADAGQVRVVRAAGDDVEVSVTAEGTWRTPTTVRERDGGTLLLSARCDTPAALGRCEVSYTVEVPDGVDVDLEVSAGRVSVDGVDGEVLARSHAGEVELTDLRSERVDAASDVGRVAVTFAEPPASVRASSETGAVEVTLPAGGEPYAVDATSDVGGTVVDVRTDPASPRSVVARTAVGHVSVRSR